LVAAPIFAAAWFSTSGVQRGVNENNVGYKDAWDGFVIPNGGKATAQEHNDISKLYSPFALWTPARAVAQPTLVAAPIFAAAWFVTSGV
jgi:hypothetical protein